MSILNTIQGKRVTVLCSGPSVIDYHDNNQVVIVPNRSILLPQISEYNKVIWIKGTGWLRDNVYSWWKELADQVVCDPDYILARKDNNKWHPKFVRFQKEFGSIFPECKITHTLDETKYGIVSTGVKCVQIALSHGASHINIAGMEMGLDTKYADTLIDFEVVSKMGNDSFTRHLVADKKYLNNISLEDRYKLAPFKKSGLFLYLNKSQNRGTKI